MKATDRRGDATAYRLNPEVVATLAKKAGVSRAHEIAALLNISRATYFRLLGGQAGTSLDTALDMAAAAGVPVTDLFVKRAA